MGCYFQSEFLEILDVFLCLNALQFSQLKLIYL